MLINVEDKARILYPSTLRNFIETAYMHQDIDPPIIPDDVDIYVLTKHMGRLDNKKVDSYSIHVEVSLPNKETVKNTCILDKSLLYTIRSWNNAWALTQIIPAVYRVQGIDKVPTIDLITQWDIDTYLIAGESVTSIETLNLYLGPKLLPTLKKKWTPSLMEEVTAYDLLSDNVHIDASGLLGEWIDKIIENMPRRFMDVEELEQFEVKHIIEKAPNEAPIDYSHWYQLIADFVVNDNSTKVCYTESSYSHVAILLEKFMFYLFSHYQIGLKRNPISAEDMFEFKAFLGKFIEVNFDN